MSRQSRVITKPIRYWSTDEDGFSKKPCEEAAGLMRQKLQEIENKMTENNSNCDLDQRKRKREDALEHSPQNLKYTKVENNENIPSDLQSSLNVSHEGNLFAAHQMLPPMVSPLSVTPVLDFEKIQNADDFLFTNLTPLSVSLVSCTDNKSTHVSKSQVTKKPVIVEEELYERLKLTIRNPEASGSSVPKKSVMKGGDKDETREELNVLPQDVVADEKSEKAKKHDEVDMSEKCINDGENFESLLAGSSNESDVNFNSIKESDGAQMNQMQNMKSGFTTIMKAISMLSAQTEVIAVEAKERSKKIESQMNALMKKVENLTKSWEMPSKPDFLPFNTLENWILFEEMCTDKQFDEAVGYFSFLGGDSVKEATNIMIKESFNDDLSVYITWSGKEKTMQFKMTVISKAMYKALCCSRYFDKPNEKELQSGITEGLRNAKQRHRNETSNDGSAAEKKKRKKSTEDDMQKFYES